MGNSKIPSSMKINGQVLALQFLLLSLPVGMTSAQLSPSYYASSCPNVLNIIKSALTKEIARGRRGIAASLLRLHFHDCFVNGCDGSVLLDDTPAFTGEKTALPNFNSLRGFDAIDNIKAEVERSCPGVVSCADILTVASRDSVVALDGPSWPVSLGRRDSTTANFSGANTDLPPPFFNLSSLISSFGRKGFTAREMVTLSGAHTIGVARCATFRDRIYNDADISSAYASRLRRNCPRSGGDDNPADLDFTTELEFDNNYYSNLVKERGLLHSDQQLFSKSGGITNQQVHSYSHSQSGFFADFANAMTKMDNLSPLTGTAGQIRTNCRTLN